MVEGAAYFGIKKNYIHSRILRYVYVSENRKLQILYIFRIMFLCHTRYTYGKAANVKLTTAQKRGISMEYIVKINIIMSIDRNIKYEMCLIYLFIKEMKLNLVTLLKVNKYRHNAQSTRTTVTILCSDMRDPKVRSDGKEIGKVTVEFDEEDDQEEVGIEFHFWDTVIKVFAYSVATPDIRKELHIDYNVIDKNYHYSVEQDSD